MCVLHSHGLGLNQWNSSCEQGNDILGSIKAENFVSK